MSLIAMDADEARGILHNITEKGIIALGANRDFVRECREAIAAELAQLRSEVEAAREMRQRIQVVIDGFSPSAQAGARFIRDGVWPA